MASSKNTKKGDRKGDKGEAKTEAQAPTVGATDAEGAKAKPEPKLATQPAADRPRPRRRLRVTRGTPVALTNYVGTLAQGRVLCEEHYESADWKTLTLYATRNGWEFFTELLAEPEVEG